MPAFHCPLLSITASLLVMLAAAGCGSVAPPASSAPRSPADQRSAAPAALATERQWLQSWFKDTPVLIRQTDDGAVSIEVPRSFCFDAGGSNLKPALAAVLDKVAESMRRVPQARLVLVAAPDDATGAAPLAQQRAAQVHKHLVSRGVAAARLGKPVATTVPSVQLRLEPVPL